jgi:hypothetical protein
MMRAPTVGFLAGLPLPFAILVVFALVFTASSYLFAG